MKFSKILISAVAGLALLPSALLAAEPAAPIAQTSLEARLAKLFRSEGLTASEAAMQAMRTSRDVMAKDAARNGAQASLDSARFAYIPRVVGSASYTRLSDIDPPALGLGDNGRFVVTTGPTGPLGDRQLFTAPDFKFPVFLDNGALRAGIVIPISDYVWRSAQQVAATAHQRDAAAWDVQAARLKAAADARVSYYQWVRGRGQKVVADQSLEQSKSRAEDIIHAFEAGSSSRADVLRGDSLVEGARLLVARAGNASQLGEEGLIIAMHAEPGVSLEVGENIFRDLAPAAAIDDFEALVTEAAGQRVELKVLGESVEALVSQRKALWANAVPRLDATGNALYANPNPRYIPGVAGWRATWDVGAALTWSPTDLPAAVAGVSAADARVRQNEAQKLAVLDALRIEVRQSWLAVKESEVALSSTGKALLSAEEAYRVRQELFRNGRATVVEVIDSETELTRARFEAINARIDARIARVRLEHATGRDVVSLAAVN